MTRPTSASAPCPGTVVAMEYTIAEAAARAGVSESTIRAARTAGAFKSARPDEARGKRTPRWLIPGDELDAAGFVPVTAAAATTTVGPIYIEQRLMHLSSQLVEVLDVLATHDEVCADWMEHSHDTAATHGEMLEATLAATSDCAASEHLAALHHEAARLSADMETRDRLLTSIAAELDVIRTSLEAWKPKTIGGRWGRMISAFRS